MESVHLPVIWVNVDFSLEFITGDSPRTECNAFFLLLLFLLSLLPLSSLAHPGFTPKIWKKCREAAFLLRLKEVILGTC